MARREPAERQDHMDGGVEEGGPRHRKRGWREIEARRERAALRELLADVWDDQLEIEDDVFDEGEDDGAYYTTVEADDAEELDEDFDPDEFESDDFDDETED